MTRSVAPRTLTIATIFLLTTIAIACKKETPAFKPEGFWRGNAYLYHAAILNRPNGTSRLYFVIPGTDTAKAGSRLEGSHSMNKGKFTAIFYEASDTLIVESTSTSANVLSGLVISTTLGQAVPFNFTKQQ
jgi:hypothetical protein